MPAHRFVETRFGATTAGIPPFPSGRRETDQHREWLALYKAHARLNPPGTHALPSDDGACGVCGRLVPDGDRMPHRDRSLHAACHGIVTLVEPLGAAGLDRLRSYLWPPSKAKRARR
mgnify:CR=1 FL=1